MPKTEELEGLEPLDADFEPKSRTEGQNRRERNADFVSQTVNQGKQNHLDGKGDSFQEPNFQQPAANLSTASWQARRDHFATAISTLSEPDPAEYGSWQDERTKDTPDVVYDAELPNPDESNASSEFLGKRHETDDAYSTGLNLLNNHGNQPQIDESEAGSAASDAGHSSGWAANPMRSWQWKSEEQEAGSLDDDDPETKDTESAIRQALKYALEHPSEFNEPNDDYNDYHAEAAAEAMREEPNYDDRTRSSQRWDEEKIIDPIEDDQDASSISDNKRTSSFSFRDFDADSENFEHEEEDDSNTQDPPFRLTGKNANAAIYGLDDHYDRQQGYDEESRFAEDSALQEPDDALFEPETEHRERVAGQLSDQLPYDADLNDFTKLYDREFEQDAPNYAGESDQFYQDIATLQPDSDSTDVTAYERTHHHGGLALVAGWAVFISVISGVILAFVSFRQEITVALPGTTSLYKTLGFDTGRTGVDFADVRYRWTTAEGKPMIEVTGQVVNVTDSAVKVPRVLVNVRDAGGTDSVTATATVPKDELAPRETTSFSLEFLSPPENVTQIELAFDDKR